MGCSNPHPHCQARYCPSIHNVTLDLRIHLVLAFRFGPARFFQMNLFLRSIECPYKVCAVTGLSRHVGCAEWLSKETLCRVWQANAGGICTDRGSKQGN